MVEAQLMRTRDLRRWFRTCLTVTLLLSTILPTVIPLAQRSVWTLDSTGQWRAKELGDEVEEHLRPHRSPLGPQSSGAALDSSISTERGIDMPSHGLDQTAIPVDDVAPAYGADKSVQADLSASLCGRYGTAKVEENDPGKLRAEQTIALLNEHSVFVIGESGDLFERCWKAKEWVWLYHAPPLMSHKQAYDVVIPFSAYRYAAHKGDAARQGSESGLDVAAAIYSDGDEFRSAKRTSGTQFVAVELANRDRGCLYVLDDAGRVLQRQVRFDMPTFTSTWSWRFTAADAQGNAIKVKSLGGRTGPDGTLFALAGDGRLIQWCRDPTASPRHGGTVVSPRDGHLNIVDKVANQPPAAPMIVGDERLDDTDWVWLDHGFATQHLGHNTAAVAIAPFVLNDQSVFVVLEDGTMAESFREAEDPVNLRRWIFHGKPHMGTDKAESLVGRPSGVITLQSFFVMTQAKKLWERRFIQDRGGWTWVEHNAPKSGSVALAPKWSPHAPHPHYVLVLSEDNRIFHRHYHKTCTRQKCQWKWKWVDHGAPPGKVITSGPSGAINANSVFVIAGDGELVEHHQVLDKWIFYIHRGFVGSTIACFAGYGSIPINTTLRCL